MRIVLAVVVAMFCFANRLIAQGPPPNASVNNRFEWDQAAPSVNEASAYIYKYYLDNGTVGVQYNNVSCVGTATPFLCSANVPQVNQGLHTIQFTAGNIAGESPKSAPFAFAFVVTPAAPAAIRLR